MRRRSTSHRGCRAAERGELAGLMWVGAGATDLIGSLAVARRWCSTRRLGTALDELVQQQRRPGSSLQSAITRLSRVVEFARPRSELGGAARETPIPRLIEE
jgi:hypothetical protein